VRLLDKRNYTGLISNEKSTGYFNFHIPVEHTGGVGPNPSPVSPRTGISLRWAEKLGQPFCPYLKRWGAGLAVFLLPAAPLDGFRRCSPFSRLSLVVLEVLSGSYIDVNPAGSKPMRTGSWAIPACSPPAHGTGCLQVVVGPCC
jgi:hypothetical protein